MARRSGGIAVGVDVGGTKVLAAVFDRKGKVLGKAKIPTDLSGPGAFLDSLTEVIKESLGMAGLTLKQAAGVGVGCPGLINAARGEVLSSVNIPFLRQFPLAKALSRRTGRPAAVENDVNAGLYGEFRFGAARGILHAAGFFLGTGIGGALILDGRLYRGATGAAGEFGHQFVAPFGPLCGCGNRGCVEAICGRPAIAAEAAVLAARRQAPHLLKKCGTDIAKIKSGALAKAAGEDAAVRKLLEAKAAALAIAVGNVANILNPELIVLGGGMTEAMPGFFAREVRRAVRAHAMPGVLSALRIVEAELGDHAVAAGAAALALGL